MASKEKDIGVVDPPREIVESESELQEEVWRLKHQMAEMYQAWIKGHPPPSFPTNYTENPTSIPPLSQSQIPNTIDLSPQHAPSFTPYYNYPGTSAQIVHAPPAKTTSYPATTSAPIFVPPPQATLYRSYSEPAFPATDAHYYAPEPTFKVPDSYSYTPQFEPHVETDKPPKNAEQEEIFRKPVGFKMPKFDLYDGHGDPVAHLRGYCSKMRGAGGKDKLLIAYFSQSLNGASLEWYTRQDASRWYTWDNMAQAFARHFQYDIDIVLDRPYLTKVEKKPSESFREYGFRRREQVTRVNPPMEEDEMVKYFLQALEPTYYSHLILAIGKSFNDVVKMGEMVEEGLKSSKIMSYSAIKATTQAYDQPPPYPEWRALVPQNTYPAPQNAYPPPQPYQNPNGSNFRTRPEYRRERQQRKQTFTPLGESYASLFQRLRQLDVLRPVESKIPNPPPKNLDYSLRCAYCSDAPGHDIEKCWHLKRATQELIDTNQIVVQSPDVPNINQNPLPAHGETHMIEIVHRDGEPKKSSKSIMIIRASESNLVKAPDSTKAMPLIVEGVAEKPSSLNSKPPVLVVKGLSKDIGASPESSKVVVPGIPSKPVIVVKGTPITPIIIKLVTQLPVVEAKAVLWNYKQVIVAYKGKQIEEKVNETGGLTRSRRCFTTEELRKVRPFKDSQMPIKKSIIEEEAEEFLKKMKILNETHVPDKITVNHLEKIAGKIFEEIRITFSDDELPVEGTEHNRDFYLTVKCEDSVVSGVLVDNGSSANICPLSTLQKLKIGTERIHLNSVFVRGFDGGGKDSVGDIMLELSIGPVEFTMEFQVLDVAVYNNLLLGRPWIHAAKPVPSSLHQMVKFEWDRQKIVVHE
ncbi:uncharacterized protein [Nicotiana sylvestris]|uniref:uncharacterized protein n=1 Tax=Nicotiana sylvestris TaxID=4096 RepID=UPI00388C8AC7